MMSSTHMRVAQGPRCEDGRSIRHRLLVAEAVAATLPTISSGAATKCARPTQQWEARQRCCRRAGIDVVVVGEQSAIQATVCDSAAASSASRARCPIFILICRPADLVEKVLALELGAADVVDSAAQRPRTGRPHRRPAGAARQVRRRNSIVLENATVDLRSALVMHRSGEEEQLSPGQVALLRLFLANPRKVLTRDDIIAAAPAENADAFDRSIDSRIVRLRRKLDTESIVTIRGSGYRFDPPAT